MTALGLPLPSAPLVDLRTGQIAPVWFRFLGEMLSRTGGAPGPAFADESSLAAMAGALVDMPDTPDLGPLTDAQATLMVLAALTDTPDPPPAPEALAALLAALADTPDAAPSPPQADDAALLGMLLADTPTDTLL